MQPIYKSALIFDVNAIGYACMYIPQLNALSVNGQNTGAIHGTIASIARIMKRFPDHLPIMLWDSECRWRRELYPAYKAGRSDDEVKRKIKADYKVQSAHLQDLFAKIGLPQISCIEAEADDLGGIIAKNLDKQYAIRLVTNDTDWWQALDGTRVDWYSPIKDSIVDFALFTNPENELKYGEFLSVNEYLESKALAGDDSDEITGLDGIGLKTAKKIIRKHGSSIFDFWSKVDAAVVIPKGTKETLLAQPESREIFLRNVKLMDWRESPVKPSYDAGLSFQFNKPDMNAIDLTVDKFELQKLSNFIRNMWSEQHFEAAKALTYAVETALLQNEQDYE